MKQTTRKIQDTYQIDNLRYLIALIQTSSKISRYDSFTKKIMNKVSQITVMIVKYYTRKVKEVIKVVETVMVKKILVNSLDKSSSLRVRCISKT